MASTLANAAERNDKSAKCELLSTSAGVWRWRKSYNHNFYHFVSHATLFGRPLYAMAAGVDPETGYLGVADAWIAVGQRARGTIAVGQFVNGGVAIGQFATGRIFALGQVAVAPVAIGQLAIGLIGVGQFTLAGLGLCQMGITFFGGAGQQLLDLGRYFPVW